MYQAEWSGFCSIICNQRFALMPSTVPGRAIIDLRMTEHVPPPGPIVAEIAIGDRPPVELTAGEVFCFGRAAGPGQISTDRSVSARHGEIVGTDAGWWQLTNLSKTAALVVLDQETPSRLHIPPSAGPVPVPFAEATIVVQAGPAAEQHTLAVAAAGADRWSGSWTQHRLRARDARQLARRVELDEGTVAVPLPEVLDQRTGLPYRWYLVLLALCEPLLHVPPDSEVPTSRRVGAILRSHGQDWLKNIEDVDKRYLPTIYRWVGLAPNSREQMRHEAVRRAIDARLVTRDDLAHLDALPIDLTDEG